MDEAAASQRGLIRADGHIRPEEPDEVERVQATLRDLEAARDKVERSLLTLRDEADRYSSHARRQLDWRAWATDHPWKTVGVAFAVGLYWGLRE